MAIAVKSTPDNATRPEAGGLAGPSLAGAGFVLAAVAAVLFGVPRLWETGVSSWLKPMLGSFVDFTGLLVVELFAIGLLAMLGLTLAGGNSRAGLKAGIFTILATLVGIALLGSIFTGAGTFGEVLGAALIIGLVFLAARFIGGSTFDPAMQKFEGQGWFSATSYKPAQGRLVRRSTLIGIVGLVVCGIYTLLHHQTFSTIAKNWDLKLPFVGKVITLLPDVRLTLPILLAAGSLWLAWRVVNMPIFAEFLIATEGELNKIAWPTRKNLIQDTIVVLTTVVVMTIFLFVVDVAWGKLLSSPYVGILRLDSGKPQAEAPDVKDLDW